MPVEILEDIFSSLGNIDPSLFTVISQVCKLLNRLVVPFEAEPKKSKEKFDRLKQSPVKRFNRNQFDYHSADGIDFHEYVHAVVQFQPFLREINIRRTSQDRALDELLILAKVPTLKEVILKDWSWQEIASFLRARQHLELHVLEIYEMNRRHEEFMDVVPPNVSSRAQFIRVKRLEIEILDDSIHEILNCLQKDHLRRIDMSYCAYNFKPSKTSLQLFGFQNLTHFTT